MIVDGEILSAATDPDTGESKIQAVKAVIWWKMDYQRTGMRPWKGLLAFRRDSSWVMRKVTVPPPV